MADRSFDTVSRQVAQGAAGRRTLLAMGAAGLMAALMGPFAAQAKNKNKQRTQKKKKKTGNPRRACPPAPDLCAPQVQPCVDALTRSCDGDPTCQDSIACCSRLGTCDFSGFISCVVTAGNN